MVLIVIGLANNGNIIVKKGKDSEHKKHIISYYDMDIVFKSATN